MPWASRIPRLPILRRMGGTLTALRTRATGSPNYRNGRFQPHEPTHWTPAAEAEDPGSTVVAAFHGRRRGRPARPVPIAQPAWPADGSDLAVTWLGHATSLVEVDGHRFLLDPVFGDRVSPSILVGPRRLHPAPCRLADLPGLDAVVISHDHYDHLDEPTIRQLEQLRRPRYVVPIGVDVHLESWGVPRERITALDWRDSTDVGGITLTCTEGRHFSGRGFVRNQTLWAGWSLRGPHHAVYFAGDSGPTHRFEDIGRDLGPFDLTLIPIGAYSEHWPDIHLDPTQALAAHLEVNGGSATGSVLLPIHWATFNLAMHWWAEPIRWAQREASVHGVDLVAPRVGVRVVLDGADTGAVVAALQEPWWEQCAQPGDHD